MSQQQTATADVLKSSAARRSICRRYSIRSCSPLHGYARQIMLFFFGVMARCIGLPLIIATLPSSKNISEAIQSRSIADRSTGRTAF